MPIEPEYEIAILCVDTGFQMIAPIPGEARFLREKAFLDQLVQGRRLAQNNDGRQRYHLSEAQFESYLDFRAEERKQSQAL